METMRLQKYIALSGIASRRKAEEMILQGRVAVNGETVCVFGTKVGEGDLVEIDGKPIYPESKKIYVMLNKPAGYVSTVKDQFGRPTVLDLINEIDERIYPVGRLDYETSGLLILTNDGDLTFKVTHPGHETEKVYMVEILGTAPEDKLNILRNGIETEDFKTSPAKIKLVKASSGKSLLSVAIHEGKNRQVRKMFEHIGFHVSKLTRTEEGGLMLGDLKPGAWRKLTSEEIKKLKG